MLGVLSDKNSASYVFADFQNNSGWASDGISWLVGLQSVVYPFLGYVDMRLLDLHRLGC